MTGPELQAQFDEEAASLAVRKRRHRAAVRIDWRIIAAGPLVALVWLLLVEMVRGALA